jgi:hypothetical protein
MPCSNSYVGENVTIDQIKECINDTHGSYASHSEQKIGEESMAFKTPNQIIENISKDIDIVA